MYRTTGCHTKIHASLICLKRHCPHLMSAYLLTTNYVQEGKHCADASFTGAVSCRYWWTLSRDDESGFSSDPSTRPCTIAKARTLPSRNYSVTGHNHDKKENKENAPPKLPRNVTASSNHTYMCHFMNTTLLNPDKGSLPDPTPARLL